MEKALLAESMEKVSWTRKERTFFTSNEIYGRTKEKGVKSRIISVLVKKEAYWYILPIPLLRDV